jgi:pyridoxal 5'-phosphate synthase pdxS subunit
LAKTRIGHFVEAQILEAIGVDYIDESEVLTPADEVHHTNKHNFKVPFVCGCRDLGEALRRIAEGCAMIRTKVGQGDLPSLASALSFAVRLTTSLLSLLNLCPALLTF